MRNPHLTEGMERVLRILRSDGDADIAVQGLTAYAGDHATSVATVYRLLRKCLVKDVSQNQSDKLRRYVLNEEGRKVLADTKYVPIICRKPEDRP